MKTECFTSQSIPSQYPEIAWNLWKAHTAIQGMLVQTDSVAPWTPSSDAKKSWVIFGTFSQLSVLTVNMAQGSWGHTGNPHGLTDPFPPKQSLPGLWRIPLIPAGRYPSLMWAIWRYDFKAWNSCSRKNTSVLIFLCSQPVKMLHIFSAPIQRNLSFTPYFMPYVGSWKNEGFSCQSLKAVQALFQLHTASDLKVWHFTLASVSTICSVSLVHCWKYSW